jgi:hypothetical protein
LLLMAVGSTMLTVPMVEPQLRRARHMSASADATSTPGRKA